MTNTPPINVSVRHLLFRWLLLPFGLVLILAAVTGYPIALYTATAAYDGALTNSALSLAQLLKMRSENNRGLSLPSSADVLLRTDQFDRIYYSVYDANGSLIAGDASLLPPKGLLSSGSLLYDGTMNGGAVRVAALAVELPESRFTVQVAETAAKRGTLITQTLAGLIVSEVVLLAVVAVLLWFGIGKGLEPLQRLREEIESRSSRYLGPVSEEHAPVEVRPVVHALNNLLLQLASALRTQKEFVANAAHQLRTPLAGLRMQVEYGLQQENAAEWRNVLVTLKRATERTAHLANQLLTLAKAEFSAHEHESLEVLDLCTVVERVAGEWMSQAIAKEIDLGLELKPSRVNGDSLLIAELLSNILDNAITYTDSGGQITIRTKSDAASAFLEVEDDGRGIPLDERERIFQRFYRLDGSPGAGCGLGLAIVNEIVHRHGGAVEIRTPERGDGTLVAVSFPLAAGRL